MLINWRIIWPILLHVAPDMIIYTINTDHLYHMLGYHTSQPLWSYPVFYSNTLKHLIRHDKTVIYNSTHSAQVAVHLYKHISNMTFIPWFRTSVILSCALYSSKYKIYQLQIGVHRIWIWPDIWRIRIQNYTIRISIFHLDVPLLLWCFIKHQKTPDSS